MAYQGNNKKTRAQKFKKLTLKTVFCTAAVGVAGGAYYYNHGTGESVIATTTQVNGNKHLDPLWPLPLSSDKVEDRTAAKACAANANAKEVAEKLPQISRDNVLLAQLRLTGAPVYEILKDPAHKIKTCLFPVPEGYYATSNYYLERTLTVPRTAATSDYFHEAFHAAQHMQGSYDIYRLTIRDAAMGNLLQEASAVAYELAAQQEAANRGLKFVDSSDNSKGASDKAGIRSAFNSAYTAGLKQHAGANAEAKALEAGGKAAVRYLLAAEDPQWRSDYANSTVKNMNKNLHMFTLDGRESHPDYAGKRRSTYNKQGTLSPGINFTPEEYLGANAEQHIDKTFKNMGLAM